MSLPILSGERVELGLAPKTHFCPEETLEAIDVRAIGGLPVGGFVNAGLFALSNYRGINGAARAAQRGRKVGTCLNPPELKMLRLGPNHPLSLLAATTNVENAGQQQRAAADSRQGLVGGRRIDLTGRRAPAFLG